MGNTENTDFRPMHEIFVLDAYLEEPLDESQKESHAKRFIGKVLKALSMEPLGSMQFHDAVDLRAPGWSFVQPITTSHISCHYFKGPGRKPHMRLDFYSCKSVDWMKVIEICHEEIPMECWHATFINRQIENYLTNEKRSILDIRGKGGVILSEKSILHDKDTISEKLKGEHLEEVASSM